MLPQQNEIEIQQKQAQLYSDISNIACEFTLLWQTSTKIFLTIFGATRGKLSFLEHDCQECASAKSIYLVLQTVS